MKPKPTKNKKILIWIPEHTSILGRKTADKYPKLAISNTDSTVLNLLPFEDFQNAEESHIRKSGIYFAITRTQI